MFKREKYPIVTELKQPTLFLIFAVITGLVFYLNYYAMAKLPGTDGYACIIGANLTPLNILFSAVISIMSGMLVAGLIAIKKNGTVRAEAGGAAGFGVLIGTLTSFCTICTIPVISLFGVSLGLAFLTEFAVYVKVVSLILMSLAVYLVNAQLKKECKLCIF